MLPWGSDATYPRISWIIIADLRAAALRLSHALPTLPIHDERATLRCLVLLATRLAVAVHVAADAVGSYPAISPLQGSPEGIPCGMFLLRSLSRQQVPPFRKAVVGAPGCYPALRSAEPGLSSLPPFRKAGRWRDPPPMLPNQSSDSSIGDSLSPSSKPSSSPSSSPSSA